MKTNYRYTFADGYTCCYSYRLKGSEKAWEVRQHGKIVEEKIA